MKGVKLNLNMDVVNCVLLVVILALVIYCVVKQNEGFTTNNYAGTNYDGNTVREKGQNVGLAWDFGRTRKGGGSDKSPPDGWLVKK